MIRRHTLSISMALLSLLISSLLPEAGAARKHRECDLSDGGAVAPVKPKRRVALVIGNNKYPQAVLMNPCNDAEDIGAALTGFGFEVERCFDATLAKAQGAIDRFIKNLGPDSVGLFYYAGHGMQIDGENYLIPVDFVDKDEPTAKRTSYSISLLSERMTNVNQGLNIIILDACRVNPYRLGPGRPISARGLAPMFVSTGTFIAFATGPNQVADENVGERNGLFTKHLLDSLKASPTCLNEVFDKTREKVARESGERIKKLIENNPKAADNRKAQIPWVTTSVIGTFCFKGSPVINSPPPPPPPVNPTPNVVQIRDPGCKGIVPPDSGAFQVEGNFEPSGIMGDIDDIRIKKLEGSTQFRYTTTGKGRHEWDYKYDKNELNNRPAQFGGVMYLNPPNNFGNVCGGIDLSSARSVIRWEARSLTGKVRVDFIIGGVSWTWDDDTKLKSPAPFPDSMPRISLGTRELNQDWQTFKFNLSDLPPSSFTRVVNGFTWLISWGSNDVTLNEDGTGPEKPKTFEIELRNIRYER